MKIYSQFSINEFIICCGYKGICNKEYFANYFLHSSDVTFYLNKSNFMEVHNKKSEPWEITLLDTGEKSNTGGRLKYIKDYINNETFCLTYGDGVSNVDMNKLISLHKKQNKIATLTAIEPPGRYGSLIIEDHNIKTFGEKTDNSNRWVNGDILLLSQNYLIL